MDTNLTYCEDLSLSDISITRCESPSILQVFEINTSQKQCSNVIDEVSTNYEEMITNDSQSTFCETPNDEINMSPNNDVNNEANLENVQNTQDEYFEVNTDRYTHISQSQDNFIISNKFILSKSKVNKIQEETCSIEDEIPFSVIYAKEKIKKTRKTFRKQRTSRRIIELKFKQQGQMTNSINKHTYFLRPKKEKKNYNDVDKDDAKTGKNIECKKRKLDKKTDIDKKETVNNEDIFIVENEIPLLNNEKNNDTKSEKTKIRKERKRKNNAQNTEESNNNKVNIKTKTSHDLVKPLSTHKKTVKEKKHKNEQQIQESDNKIIDLIELPAKLDSTGNEKYKLQKLKENKDKIDVGNNKSLELKLLTELCSCNCKHSKVKNDLKTKVKTRKPKATNKKLNLKNKTTLLTTNQNKPETKGKRKRKTKIQKIEESNSKINVETKTSHELEVPNKLLSPNYKKNEIKNNKKRKDIEQKIQESINVETNISELEYNNESNNIISSQNFYIVREINVINNTTANELDFSDFLPNSPFLADRGFETSDLKKLDEIIPFSQNSNSFNENEYFSQPYQDFTLINYNDTDFKETDRSIETKIIEEVEMSDKVHEIQENNHIRNNTAHVDHNELILDIPLSLDLDTIDLVKSNEVTPYSQNSLSLSELDFSYQDFTEKSKDIHLKTALVNSNDNKIDDCNINKATSFNLSIEITNSNITNVASIRKVRVLKEKYNDFTESQVENITFKVLEELSNVKNYLTKRERTFESPGSRYSKYPIGTFNSGSQKSNSINESAHCLLQHITSSALVVHTEHITRQISIVLGNLIDKLHEEENYPNFLEKILESVDNLLDYIYTGDNYEENMLLKKEQAINRFCLLNRSSHIVQYSIQKITKILQETLENIKLGDFELRHTDKAENICHIFNILEILLNRHTKLRKNLSQHSSQMSQDDRVIKKSALTEIWRKKWNLSKSEVCEGSSQNNNFLIECSDVLNKITIEAMDGYSLVSFAALQCYNLLQ